MLFRFMRGFLSDSELSRAMFLRHVVTSFSTADFVNPARLRRMQDFELCLRIIRGRLSSHFYVSSEIT